MREMGGEMMEEMAKSSCGSGSAWLTGLRSRRLDMMLRQSVLIYVFVRVGIDRKIGTHKVRFPSHAYIHT
jgi:hypothetical protein